MATRKVRRLSHPTASEKVPVDRISRLPDSLIHHILSFIPTIDAVRMSLLSKRWRRLWYSIPALDFSDAQVEKYFSVDGHKRFFEFVENCMNHRELSSRYLSDSIVTRFKLHIAHNVGSVALDKWISFAVRSGVEELDLRATPVLKKDELYYFPKAALSAKSLSVMKLDSLNLVGRSFSEVSLPCLKYLSLTNVALCDEALHRFLPNCPSLEKLHMNECTKLLEPRISSSSLKFLRIERVPFETVHVEAMHLEDFVYSGYCNALDLSGSRAIKNFTLLHCCIDDKSLEDLIFGLPLLENLSLHTNLCLKRVRIRGQNLKSIELDNRIRYIEGAVEAAIEAPNLVSFCYKGGIDFSLSMKSPTNLTHGTFVLHRSNEPKCDLQYIKLITFLTNVNFSWKSINIHVLSEESLIIPEHLRRICRPPWPDLKHLKVKTLIPLMIEFINIYKSDLKDALNWISPSLQTLDIEEQYEGFF